MPKNLEPTLYELQIQPYIGTNETYGDKAFTFDGVMKINFKCVSPTNRIIFHISGLKINEAALELTSSSDSGLAISGSVEYDAIREFVIVKTNRNCVQNAEYKLKIEYTGPITATLNGFYRSSYKDSNNKTY